MSYRPRWQLLNKSHWTRSDYNAHAAYLVGIEVAKKPLSEPSRFRWSSAYVRSAFMHGFRDETYRIAFILGTKADQ